MDGKPFSRTLLNPRERPLSGDLNQAQAQLDRSLREVLLQVFGGRASLSSDAISQRSGFIGDGFMVTPAGTPNMTVTLRKGLGFFYDATKQTTDVSGISGLDDLSGYQPAVLSAAQAFTVPTAPTAGNSRIDIIQVKTSREVGNVLSRDILDTGTGVFGATAINKTMKFDLVGEVGTIAAGGVSGGAAIEYRTGVAAATGTEVEPSVDTGYTKICAIAVGPAVTTIDKDVIADTRQYLGIHGALRISAIVEKDMGTGAAEIVEVHAPPGWFVQFMYGLEVYNGVAGRGAPLRAIIGLPNSDWVVVPTHVAVQGVGSNSVTKLFQAQLNGGSYPVYGVIGATRQGQINDVAYTDNPLKVAAAQYAAQFEFFTMEAINAGAVQELQTAGSRRYYLQFEMYQR